MAPRIPVATLVILTVTALVTTFAYAHPGLTDAFDRRPGGLAAGEWWRPLTALFIHPEGLVQIAADFTGLAVIGTLAERVFGPCRWLVVYFGAGILAHTIGFAWQPGSAGSSVATAGLLGGLAARMASRPAPFPPPARIGGILILAFGFGLTVTNDIHGPPILAGALAGRLFVSG